MVADPTYDALIIGGGISGLVCAHRLRQLGHEVLVIEQRDRVGGVLDSEHIGGFLLEWGAHTVSRSVELERLIDELALRDQVVAPPPTVRNRFLALAGQDGTLRMQAAPRSLLGAVSTPLLSLRGKLRILGEVASRRAEVQDLSVSDFIERRFGREVLDAVVAPALNGIWAGDVDRLSAKYSLPRLWDAQTQRGSAIRGLLMPKKRAIKRPHGIFSFRAGMATLPLALAKRLTVELSTSVESITFDDGVAAQLRGPKGSRTVRSRTVVLATGGAATSRLMHTPQFSAVPYSSVGLLQLAFPESALTRSLDGFGVLVAPRYRRALLGGIFTSSLFPDRAPNGTHLVSCFVGGARHPELAAVTEPAVQDRVIGELSELLNAQGKPTVIGARTLLHAIPAFEVGHGAVRSEADALEARYPQLKLLGSWREGISVPDRTRLAEETAQKLHHQLGEPKRS